QDFSIDRDLPLSFGIFNSVQGGRLQRVRIRFDAWAVRLVRERVLSNRRRSPCAMEATWNRRWNSPA
ncbi:MAG TPA: hypothetical protein VF614_05235, partial [Chthoniobacteraceae bacterium]